MLKIAWSRSAESALVGYHVKNLRREWKKMEAIVRYMKENNLNNLC